MQLAPKLNKQEKILLIFLLFLGLFLRVCNIDYQSLWLDELFTAHQTDPDYTWADFFTFLKADVHPPLYFIVVKVFIYLFGFTSLVLRLPSALAGTAAIYAMFVLGREAINKYVGLTAASLTCINYYGIYYSQEARSYMFSFLLATLSILYLIRLLKTLSLNNSILYGVCSLMLLYCHYYGLFLLFAQGIIVAVFFADTPKQNKWLFAKRFLISGLIVVAGFLPWLKYLTEMQHAQMTWVGPVENSFMLDYFYEYFGKSNWLTPLLIICLLAFITALWKTANRKEKLIRQPILMTGIIIIILIPGAYLIPYLRSVLDYPMLYCRYTIGVLPAYILALSIGINYITNRPAKIIIISAFVVLTFANLIIEKQYYTKVIKEQYRQLADYIMDHNQDGYPIQEMLCAWQHSYYFKLRHVNPAWIRSDRNQVIDSILRNVNTGAEVTGIWMASLHPEHPLDSMQRNRMKTAYIQGAEKRLYGAWADLYYRDKDNDHIKFVRYDRFVSGNGKLYAGTETAAVWDASGITAKPIRLEKGKYDVIISARGIESTDTFAYARLIANGKPVTDFATSEYLDVFNATLDVQQDTDMVFKVLVINDRPTTPDKKDRNAFIHFIRLRKM